MARRRLEQDGPVKSAASVNLVCAGPQDRDRNRAVTVGHFVENEFVPEHVATKSKLGQTHYRAILKHVLTPEEVERTFNAGANAAMAKLKAVPNWPYLSNVRLCDAQPHDVQRLISAAMARGYSAQTVTHIRNVVSAIFVHAKKVHLTGDNPAAEVAVPTMIRKPRHVLTVAQLKQVLGVMRYPEKEMTLFALLTSMNMGEICGLQWRCVNLTERSSVTDGEPIPTLTIAVRKHWHLGELSSIGQKSRLRNVPIPEPLRPVLIGLSRRTTFTGPDDFVLVSRTGTPIREGNIVQRRLKAIGRELEIPGLSWQLFRQAHSTLTYELGNARLAQGLGPATEAATLVKE